ncbi:4-sulfomuconolactone hydrolase [Fusarium phyllophilum]|uniref:4-sulfomuconolactone hydrolase n=1 Tax=Fusarium phyllophilum TaxID=47803 RepID=A0A8H5NB71_9HYPO|nr:4-sulfomuconolactone hydrolase [Fusarium phyllophilum]
MYGLKRIPTYLFLAHYVFISQAVARTTSSEVCDPKPDSRMPNGSWDSHLHVLDPIRFPPIPGSYEFGTYTAWDATIEETRLGCSHMVLIQPSVYGNDNTLLIDTLKAFGPERALGVVVFDVANTSTAQLQEWNDLGVRGVRLNFQSTGDAPPAEELRDMMQRYADAIRPFSWVLQIYIAMKNIPGIEPAIPNLGVKVVIDHLGHPDIPKSNNSGTAFDPHTLSGFDSMLRLLEGNNTWVKVSAVYRLQKPQGPCTLTLIPSSLSSSKQRHLDLFMRWIGRILDSRDLISSLGLLIYLT